jgi:hypothetical protein
VYPTVLWLHSALRWVVILLALLALLRLFRSASAQWSPTDEQVVNGFVTALGIQGALGLLLYLWLSPIPRGAVHDLGAAMRMPMLRFWIVEHPFGMVASIALAQIGRARIMRARDSSSKRRLARWFVGLSILLMLASLPWPGLPYGRALFRAF